MKVRLLLKKVFEITEPYAGIGSVEKRLLDNSFLVVLDCGAFLGILTPADIVKSAHQLVIDCLHDKPHVDYDGDVESVLETMNESGNFVLPVFKSGEFIGVITQSNIIAFLDEYRKELEREIQNALAKIKVLRGMLRICASCKKIKDDKGYWRQMEAYIRDHSEAEFSHSFCPDCMEKLYPDFVN